MSDRTLTSLVDEADAWGPLEWWRLELRSFVKTPYAQHTLVLLAPKEAVRAEHPGISAGSCLQSLAYMFLLVAPLVGAAAMLRWVVGGSAFDFPLAFAGVLTLISFLATAWSQYQRFRPPRAVFAGRDPHHLADARACPACCRGAHRHRRSAPSCCGDGTLRSRIVVLADVVVYAAILVRGATIKGGSADARTTTSISDYVKEVPPATLSEIIAERDAAIDLLVGARQDHQPDVRARGSCDGARVARAHARAQRSAPSTAAPDQG